MRPEPKKAKKIMMMKRVEPERRKRGHSLDRKGIVREMAAVVVRIRAHKHSLIKQAQLVRKKTGRKDHLIIIITKSKQAREVLSELAPGKQAGKHYDYLLTQLLLNHKQPTRIFYHLLLLPNTTECYYINPYSIHLDL